MQRQPVTFNELGLNPHSLWSSQWLLLASGDFHRGHYNTMTVGWGSFGVMWTKPFAQVVVRPVRYTYEFMEQYDTFTLSAFPEAQRPALQLLGSSSGRDGDKLAAAGLTPTAASQVAAPAFAEAELVVECKKLYWQDFDPGHFLDPDIHASYPQKDYHRVYFGEVLAISATAEYRR